MDIAAYVLLSHEQALRRRLDVAANNMANSSTVGFKREQPLFHDQVRQSGRDVSAPGGETSFVLDFGAVHDTRAGAFQATGNPLDVMVEGQGYLTVELPEGGTGYTRAGHLKLSDTGELVTSAGAKVLGEGGRPIQVPADQQAGLSIGSDGSVNGLAGPLGRLTITRFEDEIALSPRGDGLLEGEGGVPVAADQVRLKTGGLEGSNVEPLLETTRMVEVLRAYQSSQRMIEGLDDMRKRAIDKLGRGN
jgi:flagellar basal-body rod protein FlgF